MPQEAESTTSARAEPRDTDSAVATVQQLLERRAQILSWLGRLSELGEGEDARVVERVRADYEQRLHGVVRELSTHLDALRGALGTARERQRRADEVHAEADAALREMRLRHRIGELSSEDWEARRGELEGAVERAEATRREAAASVARLEEVLSQIESSVLSSAANDDEAEAPRRSGSTSASAASGVTVIETDATAPGGDDTVPEPTADVDQDLAFLEELDRAIAESGASATDPQEVGEEEDFALPAKGVRCVECGYVNDPGAWYCGVCGVDLA